MIFPKLGTGVGGYVNLDLIAHNWNLQNEARDGVPEQANPFNDPYFCANVFAKYHAALGLHFSYGGWMEDRSVLWRGNYLEDERKFRHLGIDLNAPAGTQIAADFAGTVVRVDDDHPDKGGWGPRIIIHHTRLDTYVVYAHLDQGHQVKVGDTILAGDIFATIGKPEHNGGWFPHLHVQIVSRSAYEKYQRYGFGQLDGYAPLSMSLRTLAEMFPDPMQYISIKK